MQDRKRKLGVRSGGVLLLVMAAASVLALAFAGSAGAGVPLGQSCNSDGQIAGGGATLQTRAQVAWIQGYTLDFCGFVSGGPAFVNSPSANSMVIYSGINDNSQTITPINGSGAGLNLISCRAVPFAGSDTPYTSANLTAMNGNPGAELAGTAPAWYPNPPAHCSGTTSPGLDTWLNPFYGTTGNYPNFASSAATADQNTNIMSFPVTGTAVAVGVYFAGTAGCPATPQITKAQISDLFGGLDTNWSQLGGAYAGCNLSVRRVVRLDGSGTTQNFKNYLKAINPNGALCDPAKTWTTVATSNGNNWPNTAGCSTLATGNVNGNVGVLNVCAGVGGQTPTPGSICYADLPDFESATFQGVSGFDSAELQNGANGAFVDPLIGHHANCDFSVITTPGPSSDGAVGLASGDSWATDNSTVHQNVWNQGTGWPACATTFDLVYTGTSTANGTTAGNPIQSLTNDARRSLYSYELYVLNEGQALTPTIFYQNLPQGLLNLEITGFKANF